MNTNTDLLAKAFSVAKALPKRKSPIPSKSRSDDSFPLLKAHPDLCSFCQSEPAVVSIKKQITTEKMSFCLLHYYTTRACRSDPSKTLVLNDDEMKKQLPYIQELFSEAFMDLQKDIATESAKSFNRMMKCANDPLSILTDNAAKSKKKKAKLGGNQNDGGFLNHIQQKEIDLIDQQKKRIEVDEMFVTGSKSSSTSKITTAMSTEANPYKRRKCSTKSSWHLVLDPNRNTDSKIKLNHETDGNFCSTTCTCGSNNVTTLENISSRMNDVSKADIWGYKRDQDEVSSKYQCRSCGKIWNEVE